jgi:ribonuclease G
MSITLHYDHSEGIARAVVTRDGKVVECFFQKAGTLPVTGAVYHGTVDRILHGNKNAFIRLENSNGFLNEAQGLEAGSSVLVQAKSEPRGDKGPGLTRNITLAGVYLIYQPNGEGIHFSRRMDDAKRGVADQHLHALLEKAPGGWVLRRSSLKAPREAVEQERDELLAYSKKLHHLPEKQSLCLPGASAFEQALLMAAGEGAFEVQIEQGTDLGPITQQLKQLRPSLMADLKIKEVKDAFDQHDLENFYQELCQRQLDLPQGGNVIFEWAETLHLIDINGGERGHVMDVNREAANLIMKHIRFRNLGGMVLVDFLKMKSREDRDELVRYLQSLAANDAHAMEIYGYTRMGLFEISRARRGQSLAELRGKA